MNSMSSRSSTVVDGNWFLNPLRDAITESTIPEGTGTGTSITCPDVGTDPRHVLYPIECISIESGSDVIRTAPSESVIPMIVLSEQTDAAITGKPAVSLIDRVV